MPSKGSTVEAMTALQDRFGRRFSYLRLSITDACNFRCQYCLPNGYQKTDADSEFLTLNEISNLVSTFAALGTWKVRLTGGEPTLRRDLLEIAETVKSTPGIRWLALSTNGYRLKKLARPLAAAGVDAVNISIDSLNPKRFAEITGTHEKQLGEILEGIEAALAAGIKRVKLNAVLLAGWNADEILTFTEWVRDRPVSVRFIELMPTGQTAEFFSTRHVRADTIQRELLAAGWVRQARLEGDGPAVEYAHPDHRGTMGIIAPYSKDFCSTCNRLRVTSRGGVRLCLFGEGDHSVRHLLASPSQHPELADTLGAILQKKDISHYLPEGIYGNNRTFSAMGG